MNQSDQYNNSYNGDGNEEKHEIYKVWFSIFTHNHCSGGSSHLKKGGGVPNSE